MAAFASQQALAAKVNVAGAKLNMKKTSARKAVKAFSARAQAVAAPAVRLILDAALLAVPRGAPAARERPRAGRRESAPVRVRSAPRARVSVLSPSLRAVTAKRPSAPENLPRVSATRDRLGSDELIRFARRAISARGAWRAVISSTAARWPRVVLAKPRARPPRPPRPTTRARRVTPTGV